MTEAPEQAARESGITRVAFGVAYDGSSFHGFAAQPGQRTVAGALVEALARTTGAEISITCAGRTDTGVHATCQVVHVDLPSDSIARYVGAGSVESPLGPELPRLARALSGQVAPEVSVHRAVVVPQVFDARHSANARRYRYDIEPGVRADPTWRHAVWHVDEPLALSAMRLATDPLIGSHDFTAFCRRPDGSTDPIVRRVIEAGWTVLGDGRLRFSIEANAFGHQMVRSIVGALVAVGRGKRRASDVVTLLRSASRVGAPTIAPASGLCLVGVRYPDELGGNWA